jgi:hypothetical protein
MGIVKSKVENGYRKAITALDGRFKRCRCCVNRLLTSDGHRCKVIGFEKSKRYEVDGDHICNQVRVKKGNGEKA